MPSPDLFSITVDRLLAGMILGLVVYVLRNLIDRWKDAIVETLAIIFVICLLAISCLPQSDSSYGFGLALSQKLQFLFWLLPMLFGLRIVERLRKHESLEIVDLFRLTSVIALAVFGATSLPATTHPFNVIAVLLIYLIGEQACTSDTPARFVSLAFSIGFLLSAITASLFKTSMLEIITLGQTSFAAHSEGTISLCAIVFPIAITPVALSWLLRSWSPLHGLAHQFASWRFNIANPEKQTRGGISSILWKFENVGCYLNHGSFGAVPLKIRDAQSVLRQKCMNQPMQFLVRDFEQRWLDARFQLATFVGTQEQNLAFCDNATVGMNEVANSFPLQPGDEVVLNNHEYGAVFRIWQRRCAETGAKIVKVDLPIASQSQDEILSHLIRACNSNTRIVVVSHITSPTAIRLPVEALCKELESSEIATCVDGPHAILQEPLRLHQLKCDFYTASCHKWLCAPIGSGFFYAHPKWHEALRPTRLSWGRLPPNEPQAWSQEMIWTGTRDYSPFLTVPNAIKFFQDFGIEQLDKRNHALARYAREQILTIPGTHPVTPESRDWFGWMVGVWLPDGDHSTLQSRLQKNYKIEIPVNHFEDRYLIRASCPLYIDSRDIDYLVHALRQEI